MTYDLKLLKDNHDALLLAEVAAWLHDMGKGADEHIINQASDKPTGYKYKPAQFLHFLASAPPLNLLSESIPLCELVEKARPKIADDPSHPWLLRTLGHCHGVAHVEKEEADSSGKQLQADTRLSDTFGFEREPLKGLTARLTSLPFNLLQNRPVFEGKVREAFLIAAGETRRPENEVTLWDWSHIVAALYKASLAGALLLGYQPQPKELRWRLLSVRVNSAMFLDNATRLPDLLVRQRLLADGFERVRKLLEEDYPLATRVYQDENANIYVVPNLSELLSATDSTDHTQQTLKELISAEFAQGTVKADNRLALSGEVIPEIKLDTTDWQAQRPDCTFDVPPIARIVSADLFTHADAQKVADWWQNTSADVCPACGLRPQGPGDKAKARKVCAVCERRRQDRAKDWAGNLSTTIWTDEVADVNGRLALIVGQFNLDEWLNGKMAQTLTVVDPATTTKPKDAKKICKNPSFARLRRVWETTRAFWSNALNDAMGKPILLPAGARLEIIPKNRTQLDLGKFHTYELVVNGVRVSVVWDSDYARFITCDNLDYLAKVEQVGKPLTEAIQRGKSHRLEEPAGYGAQNKQWGSITIEDVKTLTYKYTPAIPILAEPRTFMALVPADRALEVVKAIKRKYECEMSKVRNRLPMTLGVVYFGRRTPLAAALEAGRRMLQRKVEGVQWKVEGDAVKKDVLPDDGWPTRVEVILERAGRRICVVVPTVMGDGTTPDVWYPYWRVSRKPDDRTRWFVGPDDEHWVHVSELKAGDDVQFTPSTFDFKYLDTTARRFEVSYGANGQRRCPERVEGRGADKRQRPYLLEEVEQIECVWELLKPPTLPTTQIKALDALIEAKRRDWDEARGAPDGATFQQFVCDVLKEAHVHTDFLERAAVSGMLSDALELHLTIAKEKEEEK